MTNPDPNPRRGEAPRPNQPTGTEGGEKPAVPLEKLIEGKPQAAPTEAADRLASEAAKAPSPAIEAPNQSYPEGEDSVADLVDNQRRQQS